MKRPLSPAHALLEVGRRLGRTAWSYAITLLVVGLVLPVSPRAADAPPDLLTPAERAWLAAHPRVVLGAADDWGVFAGRDASGTLSGPLVEYIELLSRRLGTSITLEAGPWHEIVKKAQTGEIDGLAISTPLEERKQHFLFTNAFHESPDYIYLRSDDLQRPDAPAELKALRGMRVGYLKGSLRTERALAKNPEVRPVPLASYELLSRRLLLGEIDAVIAPYALEYWRASNAVAGLGIKRIVPEIESPQVMSIDKNKPELVGILNKGLAAISRDEQEAIYRRWFGRAISDVEAVTRVNLDAEERAWLAAHPVVRVGIEPGRAPIEFTDEAGKAQGLSLAYLERLGKILGLRFELRTDLSRKDALEMLARGEVDVLPALARTPLREQVASFTQHYASFPAAIFSATNVTYIDGPDGLKGKTVAVVRGDAVEEWLRQNWPDLNLLPVADAQAALKSLTDGRAYAFVGNLLTTSYYIGQTGLAQIRVAGETPFVYQIGMGARRDWPMLASILQKGIAAIPPTERIAIYRDWISVRYQHRIDYSWLWVVGGGSLLVLLLVFGERSLRLKRLNARLQRLAKELTQVEGRERQRLAGELHDSPMQKLALAQLQLSAASREVELEDSSRLKNGLGLMREALDELHTLQFELSPPLLYREGLAPALEWLAANATERFGVAFSFEDASGASRTPEDLAVTLFQISRELVYNVAKHADASSASIGLSIHAGEVELRVTDDGSGFMGAPDGGRRPGGFGLFSVRERIALFGGSVHIATTDAGSTVSIRVPLRPLMPESREAGEHART